jgi:tRNA G18 (ribose-2'-O)-methylase SpoU
MNERRFFPEITSRDNSYFKEFRALLSSKGIKEAKQCLVSGSKHVQDLVLSGRLGTGTAATHRVVAEILAGEAEPLTQDAKLYRFSRELFRELDEVGDQNQLFVVEVPELSKLRSDFFQNLQFTAVLPLSDPSNLGAATRSCAAFGVSNLILTQESANPFLSKAIRASAGAVFNVNFSRGPALKELLTQLLDGPDAIPNRVCVLDMEGTSLREFVWPKGSVLVVGEEGRGLPKDIALLSKAQRICIPIQKMESLNATVALSIALFCLS